MSDAGQLKVEPGGPITGRLQVPGDKSISHRAVMLGAIATGETCISRCLLGEDVRSTIDAFRALGVAITCATDHSVSIKGQSYQSLSAPSAALDLGNSGTSMRLMAGLLCAAPFPLQLDGDRSLRRRPMNRVCQPLSLMGAKIATGAEGRPPLEIEPTDQLRGIDYAAPVASAQVKSALMLAGLNATGTTRVTEIAQTRDHSERMFRAFGIDVEVDSNTISIVGGQRVNAADILVPGDISSAAFFLVAASICPGSELVLSDVGVNPTRTGVIDILRLMGADIEVVNARVAGAEPIADLRVRSAALHGIEIPSEFIPSAIDEFPVLFVAAAYATGTTTLRGAAELRVKESDRIEAMAVGLQTLGIAVRTRPDGIEIDGSGGEFAGGQVASCGDHRVAMAFAVAGLVAAQSVVIDDCSSIATSFPGFVELARAVGMNVAVAPAPEA